MEHIFKFAPILIMALFAALLVWLGFNIVPVLLKASLMLLGIWFVFKLITRG